MKRLFNTQNRRSVKARAFSLFLVMVVGLETNPLFAQLTITGATSVSCGSNYGYTLSGGSGTVDWEAISGTITTSNNTSASVTWTGSSSGTLIAEVQGSGLFPGILNVTISGPAAPSASSNSGCPNTNIVLTANQSVRWYSASSGGTLLSTGTTYTHNGTTSLTVYAAAYSGSCESTRVAATATVSCGSTMISLARSYVVQEPGHTTLSAVQAQTSATDVLVTSSYVDGLGRPVQSVARQVSPDSKDVVTVMEYDNLGRNIKQYLPFKSTGNAGTYKTNVSTESSSFYTSQYGTTDDDYAYSLTNTDNSPLNRTIKQMAPGQPWVGSSKGVSMDYRTNTSAESVVRWTAGTGETSVPTNAGYYAANKLMVVQTTDEQNNKVLEYTDFQGRVILKKVQDAASPSSNHTGWLCTYYIYDIYGNLKTVIPPKAVNLISNDWVVSTTESDELLFHYYYDDRNRMIVKKVPGASKTEMVYDQQDRLVLSRDGKQTTDTKWVFTKYDYLGRAVMTGTYNGSTARSTLQTAVNSDDSAFEVRKTSAGGYTLYHNYYVKAFASLSSLNIESVTYYDDYSFTTKTFTSTYNSAITGGTFAETPAAFYNVNGVVTGGKTLMLGQSTWTESVNFYDAKGRLIQSRSVNHLGGEDIVTNAYDFSGKVLRTLTHHKNPLADDFPDIKVLKQYAYDHAGRLTAVSSSIDSDGNGSHNFTTFQTLAANTYDAIGQLSQKAMGNNKQYVNYTYNIRGWLTQINNPASLGTDYFGMKLKYNDATDATDMFNGNIAEIEWASSGDTHQKRYEYSYDYSSRLTGAVYDNLTNSTYDNDFSVSNITYDPNGNLQTLTRRGRVLNSAKDIDILNYDYNNSDIGNKLTKVTDTGVKGKIGDFLDGSSATTEYTYDASGNMLTDLNKGISSNITYNRLNLPELVNMGGSRTITYRYDAMGAKLQKITNDNGTIVTTDYVGGFIYENNNLQHFAHEEGRVRKNSQGSLVYDYYLKDHLGNTRTTFTTETAPSIVYKATMESENDNLGNNIAAFEEQVFFNLDGTRYTNSTANQSTLADDNCTSCNEVSRTNGSLTANRVGAALLLDVMPGDELDLEVWAYNEGGISTATSRIASSTLVSALVSAFVPNGSGTDLHTQTNSIFTGVSTYLTGGGSSGTTTPFAFLNYIVFDNNFTRLASGHQRVSSTLNAKHLLTLSNINITQKGYVYVWVSNESNENKNTYFDDLKVTHTKGSILQEDHYYPFGGSIASLSSTAPLSKPNKYKFNGNEEQTDFDLNVYDFNARTYDPILGRFMQVDPMSDKREWVNPYNYVQNNPLLRVDPAGMVDDPIYNIKGKLIGDDGQNNGKVHIVYNDQQADQIKQTTGNINLTGIDKVTLEGGKETVEGVVASVKAVGKNTSKGANDAGLHEEGGHTEKDANGQTQIVAWDPGAKKSVTSKGTIDLFNGIPRASWPTQSTLLDSWHVHTSKTQEVPIGNNQVRTFTGSMTPSGSPSASDFKEDFGMARSLASHGYNSNQIQVGTSKGRVVNFYNGSGVVASMKFSKFKKILK